MPSADLAGLTTLIRDFSEAREWEQFHTPKNLAMALAVEAAELMEHFQWLTPEEAAKVGDDPETLRELSSEMADVAIFLLRMADVLGVDLGVAIREKVEKNESRFPVDRVRGRVTLPPDDDSQGSGG